MNRVILPGSTIGILGSGQLGRMLAVSARQHGYKVVVFSPEAASPAGQIAGEEIIAPYRDLGAVSRFASRADVVTFEFENVPAATAKAAAERTRVHPSPDILHVAQNRLREKAAAERSGLATTPYSAIHIDRDLDAASSIGFPAVLKTATAGYDGKGQRKVNSADELEAAFQELGEVACILESFVPFVREISVVVARNTKGDIVDYGVFENHHVDHILDLTVAPGRVSPSVQSAAVSGARALARDLELVGVFCVEMFETHDGRVLFNEMAPRPHNSGHLTIEGSSSSQFEQQLRAICGLPLGQPNLRAPAVAMANLLGDLWTFDMDGGIMGEPRWAEALATPAVHLHLYGKRRPRLGRKMGHLTALGSTPEEAISKVREARARLLASA